MPVVKQTADLGQYFGCLPPIIPSKVLHEMINALWRRNFVTPITIHRQITAVSSQIRHISKLLHSRFKN